MKNSCKCGGKIEEYNALYECKECLSKVWKNAFGIKIKENIAKGLLAGDEVVLKGLKSKQGGLYDTKAKLINGELKLIFDDETSMSKICTCSCGGNVHKINKGYKCYSCEKIVWDIFLNKKISLNQVKNLFRGLGVTLKDLKSKKGNEFDAVISLDKDGYSLEYI